MPYFHHLLTDVKLYNSKILTCERFDACTSESTKARIIESFTKPDGAVRIVISTVAFAMGIDVPNIIRFFTGGRLMTLKVMCKRLEEEGEMMNLLEQFYITTKGTLQGQDM